MSIIREFARFIEPTGELEYDNTTSGLSATTIKSAIDELNTLLGGGNVGSQATFSIYEFAAAGGQTIFDLSGTFTTGGDVTAGNFITNETYKIQTTGTTDFTLIGAADSNPGTVFTATGPGTGTGTARVAVTYIPGYIQVYVNGVFIASTDYTASNGQTVVLTEAAEASDLVTVVVLDSFNTATQLRVINVDASAPDDSLVVDNVGDVSVTSDIKLADNGKAIFGAGSDLQIYHDGFSSYIEESGAGSLLIRGDNLFLTNTAGDQSYFDGIAGGEAIVRHNNLPKLTTTATGVDVTGTVTADGLTVDATSPVIELAAGNNNDSRIVFSEAAADIYSIKVNGTSGSLQDFTIYHDLTSATTARFQIDQNGDISFYEDTGTTAKLFWDASAESLGIGTTSPSSFAANASNLVVGSGSGTEGITINSGTANYGVIYFADGTSGSAAYAGSINYNHADNSMRLGTNGSTTSVIIDSAGNLLVGTAETPATLITTSTTSHAGTGISDIGYLSVARDLTSFPNSGGVAFFNRLATDGPIADFRKDGTTVGSIGNRFGAMYVHSPDGTNGAGLRFADGYIQPCESNGNDSDNDTDLGQTNSRFKDLYLSGGAYLGGTAAANKLDDYEEGTFTPTIIGDATAGSGTYTRQNGNYTKVGNLVFAQIRISWTAHTGTGNMRVNALPFTQLSTAGTEASAAVGASSVTTSAGTTLKAAGNPNTTQIVLYEHPTGGGSFTGVTLNTAADLMVSMVYVVA